jgi:hypothetical protein
MRLARQHRGILRDGNARDLGHLRRRTLAAERVLQVVVDQAHKPDTGSGTGRRAGVSVWRATAYSNHDKIGVDTMRKAGRSFVLFQWASVVLLGSMFAVVLRA